MVPIKKTAANVLLVTLCSCLVIDLTQAGPTNLGAIFSKGKEQTQDTGRYVGGTYGRGGNELKRAGSDMYDDSSRSIKGGQGYLKRPVESAFKTDDMIDEVPGALEGLERPVQGADKTCNDVAGGVPGMSGEVLKPVGKITGKTGGDIGGMCDGLPSGVFGPVKGLSEPIQHKVEGLGKIVPGLLGGGGEKGKEGGLPIVGGLLGGGGKKGGGLLDNLPIVGGGKGGKGGLLAGLPLPLLDGGGKGGKGGLLDEIPFLGGGQNGGEKCGGSRGYNPSHGGRGDYQPGRSSD